MAGQARDDLGILWNILFGVDHTHTECSVMPPTIDAVRDNQSGTGGTPESPIEELLVAELRRRQSQIPRFTLQYRICDETGRIVSRADIAFVAAKVAVYCDGAKYHLERHQSQRICANR